MKTVTKREAVPAHLLRRKRVAAYTRTSCGKEVMMDSLSAQVRITARISSGISSGNMPGSTPTKPAPARRTNARSSSAYWEELRACGNLGLAKAAATFSPENGACFSTYASTCIHHEICKMLRKHKKHRVVTVSLDDILAGTDSMRLHDVLPDDTDLLETMNRKLLVASTLEALRALPPKHREVWELRLGLTGEPP